MSYTPTEWHTGDIVTANKLNNLEQGVVDAQYPDYTVADKGKFLGLVEDAEHTETVVIVPEQTVTPQDGSAIVPEFDFSNVSDGDSFTLTVNGDAFTGVVAVSEQGILCAEETSGYGYLVAYNYEQVIFSGEEIEDNPYTISLVKSITAVEPTWTQVSGLPDISGVSDAGKVVTVNAAGSGYELDTPESELPAYTSADNGKVLTVSQGAGQTIDIVPQQNVSTSGGTASLSNTMPSEFTIGDTVYILIKTGPSYSVTEYDGTATLTESSGIVGVYSLLTRSNTYDITAESLSTQYPDSYIQVTVTKTVYDTAPAWTALESGVTYDLPVALETSMQTLMGSIITSIITNSKTTLVGASQSYNGADAPEIIAAIRSLADAYIGGNHVTVDVFGMSCVPSVLSKSEHGGGMQAVMPHYKITSPVTKEFTIFIELGALLSGSTVTGVNIHISAQAWDSV